MAFSFADAVTVLNVQIAENGKSALPHDGGMHQERPRQGAGTRFGGRSARAGTQPHTYLPNSVERVREGTGELNSAGLAGQRDEDAGQREVLVAA